MTKKAIFFRRSFLKGAVVSAGAGALAGLSSRAAVPEQKDSLEELKLMGKKNLSAYEFFTRGLGEGSAIIETPKQVSVAETVPETVIIYSTLQGIAPGGLVKLWCPNGATNPQLGDSNQPGFVQVETTVPYETELDVVNFWKQYNVRKPDAFRFVNVKLPQGLLPGETVKFRWKNVKVDSRAGRFEGDCWLFQVAVDHDADGFAELIPNPPGVPKRPESAVQLLARISSSAVTGESVRLNICAFDQFDNPASGYTARLTVTCDQADVLLPDGVEISAHGALQCEVRFKKPGFYWIKVRSEDGLEAESNPVEVFDSDPGLRLYWGDIHVHTEMSADARAATHTTSSYADSYKIGRDHYALDFQANSDHHGWLQGNYGPEDWQDMQQITNKADDSGRFVTLIAVELSGPKGDQNVYFSGDTTPFLSHDPADPLGREKAWAELLGIECFTVPHHFCQSMRPWDWSKFNPELQPVAEIFSNHGRQEFHDNDPSYSGYPVATLPGRTWVEQLDNGKKMGAIASSDDHWARPGTCGLTGVWVPTLTRAAVYQAIKTRRCYATTDARVILHFNVNGAEMGREIECAEPPLIQVRAAAPGRIEKLEIIRNGKAVYSMDPRGKQAETSWKDTELQDAYYYVRLTLAAEKNTEVSMKNRLQFVWSSPVWVSGNIKG